MSVAADSEKVYDVIVIGVGTMGSAACCHLARRGADVLGLEQHALVHDLGSHHGHARMIRQAYFEHPDYVPLLQRAYQNWDELEAETGQRSLYRTGGLYMGKPDGTIVSGSLHAAELHNLPHEILDHATLRERFPAFRIADTMVGFYEPDAGYLVPETAVTSHIQLARKHGADIREHQTVEGWTAGTSNTGTDEILVRTTHTTHRARHLVITAGAWTSELLDNLPSSAGKNFDLTVTRQLQAWFAPPRPEAFRNDPGNFPCWFIESEAPFGHYGFPVPPAAKVNAPSAIKVAIHKPGNPTSPQTVDRTASASEIEDLAGFLKRHLPHADGPLVDSSVCLYTNSQDGHFILDRHPAHSQVTIACGFSGHGFKFASVIGEALADLALNGHSDLPVDFLRTQHRG